MRLLNVKTYKLEEFGDDDLGRIRYAILSHRWGEREVLYKDVIKPKGHRLIADSPKLRGFCEVARKHRYTYVWIDSCTIDRESSAELNEAINRMYRWYKEAGCCYVYLSDVSIPQDQLEHHQDKHWRDVAKDLPSFEESNWFKRGWTLQELLAPRRVEFYDVAWNHISDRYMLAELVSRITKIPSALLQGESKNTSFSIAQRMSWAAGRVTTRGEDRAYSLLGIFGINMATNYGEGSARAFIRLQEELIRQTTDQSIFAWYGHGVGGTSTNPSEFDTLIADSPDRFQNCGDIRYKPGYLLDFDPYWINNTGLQITARILKVSEPHEQRTVIVLNCARAGKLAVAVGLFAVESAQDSGIFLIYRAPLRSSGLTEINTLDAFQRGIKRTITICRNWQTMMNHSVAGDRHVRRALIMNRCQGGEMKITQVNSCAVWDAESGLITLRLRPSIVDDPVETVRAVRDNSDYQLDRKTPHDTEFELHVQLLDADLRINIGYRTISDTGSIDVSLKSFRRQPKAVIPNAPQSGKLPLETQVVFMRMNTIFHIKLICEDGVHERFLALYFWSKSYDRNGQLIDNLDEVVATLL